MIQSCVLLGTLGVHSIEDIREKKITVMVTLLSGIIGISLHLFFQNQSIYEMLTGVLAGSFILILSRLTKGRIGMGDGIIFMLTGLYLGLIDNLLLMCISFSLAGIWGLFLVFIKSNSRSERNPFIPFFFFIFFFLLIR